MWTFRSNVARIILCLDILASKAGVMFDTSCPSRDDPRLKEYSMMFPNKLNPQEILLCAMKKY